MRSSRRKTLLLIAVVAFALPVAGGLQYRWLNELSSLEQLRARALLERAARQLSTEFDARLAQAYDAVFKAGRVDDRQVAAAAIVEALGGLAPRGLVRRVHLLERAGPGSPAAFVLEPEPGGQLRPAAAWPAWLQRPGAGEDDELHAVPSGLSRSLLDDVPALVVPLHQPGVDRWAVLELDRPYIVETVLPAMLAGGFHEEPGLHYDILISREDVPTDVIYASRPGLQSTGFDDWVSRMPLFALHSLDMSAPAAASLKGDAAGHRWRLFVRPQAPGLEGPLRAARLRNLGLGLGTLALLGVSVTLLVVSASRMQRAAYEQLEVVARISHELRTPLASIRCAGENLADGVVTGPEDTRAYGEMIRASGQRLTRTLQDILLCCRLQARPETVLRLEPVDLAEAIAQAVADSRLVVGPDAQAVSVTVEPGLPPVLADREALGLVLKNLVTNALSHGGGAAVAVTARLRRPSAGRDVTIAVSDAGPGIPADELPRLFEPFFRGRAARDRQVAGTGIGLSLVREAVESQGGRIRVASAPGCGTTFTIQLPAARPGGRALS